jgi:glucosamine--fructose-6-phosphate aminotransferase (isomerizing)
MSADQHSNPMKRQVWSLPDLITDQYEDLEPKVRKLLTTPEIFSFKNIYLTGCGDSFAACMAARAVFQQMAGVSVEVVPAIELARHYVLPRPGAAPNLPALIAVSNSGQVARVVEAVKRVNQNGGFTIGVTGKPGSLLGQEVSRVLELDIPAFESAPGVRSYLASMFSLFLLAIRLGEVRGCLTMDEANSHRWELVALSSQLQDSLAQIDQEIRTTAEIWKLYSGFEFIGAGPDYASAWYGHAKVLEATGRYAMAVNTEDWLHLNFFIRDVDKTAVVLVVDKNAASMSRAREVAEHIARMGRPFLILSSAAKDIFPKQARLVVFPETSMSWMSPLVSFVPSALLAGYISAALGEEYGRGAKDNWQACKNGATTQNSKIIVLEECHHA